MTIDFQKRIGFGGDIKPILQQVCRDFDLDECLSHKVIPVGYEDFNLIVTTSKGKYFSKLFATFRDEDGCQRYIDIMVKAIESGVKHPKLLSSSQGYLHKVSSDGIEIRLCVMEFINGVSFYEQNLKATKEEMLFLVQQASLINKIDLKPKQVYDSWAIIHFLQEYDKKKQYLDARDTELIEPLVKQFSTVDIDKLPHCFVHGDIIKTNVMRTDNGGLYILDFSVSSYYPRIQELAVLLCNMLFDEDNPTSFEENYNLAVDEYTKHIPLEAIELDSLPIFVKVAHAMHVVCATYEKKVNNNLSAENEYWIDLGKNGLEFTTKQWNG